MAEENTTTTGETAAPGPQSSLRERKKLATRRALQRVALGLVAERGYAGVTVEDIAEAANVSPRTFFNYFPSKDAALFAADPERTEDLRRRLVAEPASKTPLEALRTVMVEELRRLSEELAELGGEPADWICRMKQAMVDPHLRAAQAAHMSELEHAVVTGLAERLGTDPKVDPYPVLLASAAIGLVRAVISIWANLGDAVALDSLADSAFQALAKGLPQDWGCGALPAIKDVRKKRTLASELDPQLS
jgi:AcrR family transcriptional regulator